MAAAGVACLNTRAVCVCTMSTGLGVFAVHEALAFRPVCLPLMAVLVSCSRRLESSEGLRLPCCYIGSMSSMVCWKLCAEHV
jgi:hypothetical protein